MKTNEIKSEQKNSPVSLDSINQANLDFDFVKAVIDVLYELSSNAGPIEINSSIMSALTFEARNKLNNLKKFMETVPLAE